MGPDQGEAELVDLGQECLEAFVLGDPCCYLREEILGDVDGPSLVALPLEGQMLAGVAWAAVVASAGRPCAACGEAGEGGGEDGLGGVELLEACVAHASDEGGMIGDTHGTA